MAAEGRLPAGLTAFHHAWAVVLRDPVGILGPAAVSLWVQAGATAAFWSYAPADVGGALRWAFLAYAAVVVAQTPLRWATLRAGAAVVGRRFRGLGGLLPLLGAQLVSGAAQLAAVGGVAAGGAAASAVVAASGWPSVAVAAFGATCVAAVLVHLALRVVFAYAAVEVLCGGASGVRAVWRSLRWGRWSRAAWFVVGGDLLTGLGALLCGAGALPGYPIADLAALCDWEA